MSEGDDGQGGSRQTEEPMQQVADQAGGQDDRASTGGVSSLDFNIFSNLENDADTLEMNEPADEGISTPESPSAFMEMKRNLPESGSPGNSRNNEQKILMESPRRRRIEGSTRVPFLGTLPEEEWASPIKMTPQDDEGEVVYLSRTRRGTMRSKMVIDMTLEWRCIGGRCCT